LLHSALRSASLDPAKSFLTLGGDSLAYLEVQLFLSNRLGNVPEGWEHLPLRQLFALEKAGPAGRPGWQRVPADLIGRNVAILAVIALHSTTWRTGGGSILLLILVGYSLARFQSEVLFSGQVGKTMRTMLGPIVALYYAIIAVAALKFSPFDSGWFFLVENLREEVTPDVLLPYWFVSTYVQIIALAALPFAIAPVRERVKKAPFEAGVLALLAVALLIRLTDINDIYYNIRHRNPIIGLELLLTGWCMFFATTTRKKLVATAAILLVWMQNYALIEVNIAVLMLGGALCTLWGLSVSLPGQVARALLFFGSLSMFVYLAHVPALYGVSRFADAGALRFLGAIVVSLLFAQALKKTSDLIMNRLAGSDLQLSRLLAVFGKNPSS
jgi:peptidoglycan/LPS O-acetylase OafA/YrhL